MPALIVGVVVVLLFAMTVTAALIIHRRENGGSPRRRELREAQRQRDVAAQTITRVRYLVDLYHGKLDLVGDALVSDVRDAIREHDQQILDPRKKEDK